MPHTEEHRSRIGAAMLGKRTVWTRERLLEWGRALKRKPTLTDVLGFQKAVYREFDSLPGFQIALGHEPNGQGRPRKNGKGGKT